MTASESDLARLRFTQGVVAVLVIGGFVFRAVWINPVVATVVGVGLLLGPQADLMGVPFDRWIASRVRTSGETIPAARAHLVAVTTIAGLAAATLLWAAGLVGVAWFAALLTAGSAALFATTEIVAALAFGALRRRG